LKGPDPFISVETSPQSPQEVEINGSPTRIPWHGEDWRKPFVLLIDDVLDPGNLGAIIRSAYFLGVDAIAISTRTCAPITSTALKASAGAAEAIPIFNVELPFEFLKKSHDNRWRIYCGTTPDTNPSSPSPRHSLGPRLEPIQTRYTLKSDGTIVSAKYSPLKSAPSILVLGGEGKGLRKPLTHYAWAFAEILPKVDVNECGVDSLNVSVAAALLCADMLRPRLPPTSPSETVGNKMDYVRGQSATPKIVSTFRPGRIDKGASGGREVSENTNKDPIASDVGEVSLKQENEAEAEAKDEDQAARLF
jgi:21S rRNA (GM2251-2'-O)-methyltransferase